MKKKINKKVIGISAIGIVVIGAITGTSFFIVSKLNEVQKSFVFNRTAKFKQVTNSMSNVWEYTNYIPLNLFQAKGFNIVGGVKLSYQTKLEGDNFIPVNFAFNKSVNMVSDGWKWSEIESLNRDYPDFLLLFRVNYTPNVKDGIYAALIFSNTGPNNDGPHEKTTITSLNLLLWWS